MSVSIRILFVSDSPVPAEPMGAVAASMQIRGRRCDPSDASSSEAAAADPASVLNRIATAKAAIVHSGNDSSLQKVSFCACTREPLLAALV